MNKKAAAEYLVALARKLAVARPEQHITAAEPTKRDWEDALRKDEAMLDKYEQALKKIQKGEKVQNLTEDNAKKVIKSLRQVIDNKKTTMRKYAKAGDGSDIIKKMSKVQGEIAKDIDNFQREHEKQSIALHDLFKQLVMVVKRDKSLAQPIADLLRSEIYTGDLDSRGVDLIESLSGEKLYPSDASAEKNRAKWAIVSSR